MLRRLFGRFFNNTLQTRVIPVVSNRNEVETENTNTATQRRKNQFEDSHKSIPPSSNSTRVIPVVSNRNEVETENINTNIAMQHQENESENSQYYKEFFDSFSPTVFLKFENIASTALRRNHHISTQSYRHNSKINSYFKEIIDSAEQNRVYIGNLEMNSLEIDTIKNDIQKLVWKTGESKGFLFNEKEKPFVHICKALFYTLYLKQAQEKKYPCAEELKIHYDNFWKILKSQNNNDYVSNDEIKLYKIAQESCYNYLKEGKFFFKNKNGFEEEVIKVTQTQNSVQPVIKEFTGNAVKQNSNSIIKNP